MPVRALYHYPIKGFSPQPLERVELTAGQGLPFDRVFGLARADSGFDPNRPVPLPKQRFFMLARNERLAELQTFVDPQTCRLTVHVAGELVHESDLSTTEGATATVDFLMRRFELDLAAR